MGRARAHFCRAPTYHSRLWLVQFNNLLVQVWVCFDPVSGLISMSRLVISTPSCSSGMLSWR